MQKQKIARNILWAARILGSLVLAFLLFFLVAHIFGEDESGQGFQSSGEVLSFIFFPISTLVGLSIGWKWEGAGGIITVGGMIGLFLIRPELISNLYMAGAAVPGILFLIYWWVSRE